MAIQWKWFWNFKDRIIYGIVFVLGLALLVLGFSGGEFLLLCAGAVAMFLSWGAWEWEWEFLHWSRTRSKHRRDGDANPQNEYPSDSAPACESTDYDSGPHFTYDLGRRPLSFPYPIPSEKPPSAQSSLYKAIILNLLVEAPELSILIALSGFGAVVLLVMAGSIYLSATYPITVFAIAFVITFGLYIRDRRYLINLLALWVVLGLCLIGLVYSVATYPIAALAIAFMILSALYIRDRLYLKKRRSAQKSG